MEIKIILLLIAASVNVAQKTNTNCSPNRVTECQYLGYTHTMVPNLLGMRDQDEASAALLSFGPLIQFNCSPLLKLLLCGFYAPMCSPIIGGRMIPPCRKLCVSVKDQCAPVMQAFSYTWPLNCSMLPSNNSESSICIDAPPRDLSHSNIFPSSNTNQFSIDEGGELGRITRCKSLITYNQQDKEYASVWMAIWGLVCCGMSLMCIVSFALSHTRYALLESSSFTYPERCGFHLVICYLMISIGYLLRIALGPSHVSCATSSLMKEFDQNASCLLVFLLLYYFNNAAALWWVILCLCWLLASWKRYHHSVLVRYSVFMHASAWGLPAILTIGILIKRDTELQTDDLTGICSPGINSSRSLMQWVIGPELLSLLIGSTVILLTFSTLYRDHSTLQRGANTTEDVRGKNHFQLDEAGNSLHPSIRTQLLRRPAEMAMRLGVITMLYMLPAICKISIQYYESQIREVWLIEPHLRPSIELFMFKTFCSLVPGIMLSLFFANSRTRRPWGHQRGQTIYNISPEDVHCSYVYSHNDNVTEIPKYHKNKCIQFENNSKFKDGLVSVHAPQNNLVQTKCADP